MKKALSKMALLTFVFALGAAHASEGEFPHREKYKSIPVLEIDALRGGIEKSVVVDVRSAFEFSTLHIKGAINVPLNSKDFAAQLQELRKRSDRPIVFYCNGHTCKKSYQAVETALAAGISNTHAYDAGIYAWAKKHPDLSVLLGQTPMQANEFIDNSRFKNHVLPAAEFEARIGPSSLVLDIRDLRQRDVALFPFMERRAQLDEAQKIATVVEEAKRQKKTLLVYDKVGKQARWFQYYLERQGVKDYYFLDGGSEGYYEAKFGKPVVALPDHS